MRRAEAFCSAVAIATQSTHPASTAKIEPWSMRHFKAPEAPRTRLSLTMPGPRQGAQRSVLAGMVLLFLPGGLLEEHLRRLFRDIVVVGRRDRLERGDDPRIIEST